MSRSRTTTERVRDAQLLDLETKVGISQALKRARHTTALSKHYLNRINAQVQAHKRCMIQSVMPQSNAKMHDILSVMPLSSAEMHDTKRHAALEMHDTKRHAALKMHDIKRHAALKMHDTKRHAAI